ncbi:MAG: hypothetical protein AMXMBFR23_23940 [Chloroflexota bacterium]
MLRRPLLIAAAAAACVLLLGACSEDEEAAPPSAGVSLADRWLRLGEDPRADVLVFDRALPAGFSDLLNPAATADTPETERLTLPVHPEGTLLGSYLIRRTDGANLIWLMYDLPGKSVGEVADVIAGQLDQTPWQVTGGQANSAYTLVSFISTQSGDLEGTAVVQAAPALATFELVVDRAGTATTLTVPRGALIPLLDSDLADDLAVRATRPGLATASGLRSGDRITSIAGTAVSDRAALEAALNGLGQGAGAVASITYLLQIAPSLVAEEQPFSPPAGLTLPASMPAREVFTPYTVVDHSWTKEPGGSFWQTSLVTLERPSDVVTAIRAGLEAGGWEITDDVPVGFATQIAFEHLADGYSGVVQVDLLPEDEDYTYIAIQIQTGGTGGN